MRKATDVLILYHSGSIGATELADAVRAVMRGYSSEIHVVTEAMSHPAPPSFADLARTHAVIVVTSGDDAWAESLIANRDYEVPSALVRRLGSEVSVHYMPPIDTDGWHTWGSTWQVSSLEMAIWRLLPYLFNVGRGEGAFARSSQFSAADQVAVKAAVDEFCVAAESTLKVDERLDSRHHDYIQAHLKTLEYHANEEDAGDPFVIERSIAGIVARFDALVEPQRVQQLLVDLGVDQTLAQDIETSLRSWLGDVAKVGSSEEPFEDARLLIESRNSAEMTVARLARLTETSIGQEYADGLDQPATVSPGFIFYIAYRLEAGIERALFQLLGAWPSIVDAVVVRTGSAPSSDQD